MIYILHGNDTLASYNRLQLLLNNFQDFEKIKLDEKSEKDEYVMALFGQDLIEENKVIICANFLSAKKVIKKDIANIPEAKPVIFWEKEKINSKFLTNIKAKILIEEFKTPAKIFYFLDSLSHKSKQLMTKLKSLSDEETRSLIWHLSNRVMLLLLAKLNTPIESVNMINGRPLQDWQWDRITKQAQSLDTKVLRKIFNGILKIDFLIKNGNTDLNEKTLISILFLKYIHT